MSAKVEIDELRWPKVYVTWPAAAVTDEEFRRAVKHMSDLVRREEAFVVLHDARKAYRPTPTQRSFAAEKQKADADYSRRWLRGAALVVSSPVISGVATAINWIFPPPYPQKMFSGMEEAEAWIERQLHPESVDEE